MAGLVLAVACGPAPKPPEPPDGIACGGATSEPQSTALDPDLVPIVPRPSSIGTCTDRVTIDAETRIRATGDALPVATLLASWLGLPPPSEATAPRMIDLSIVDPRSPSEGYGVDVDGRVIRLQSASGAGLFYAAETFAVLAAARPIGATKAPPLPRTVPCVHIVDQPRLAWRGMHLDVARHFFPKEVVERYVDLLSFYKLDVFHWHLTDDQGFRLRLPSAPELASSDGSYSVEDVTEVVAYAKARAIDVVPEIEMPGHARAILAAHPELSCTGKKLETPKTWGVFEDVLCAGNDATYALVDKVLADVAAIFPGPYVHVGGDEVPTTRWAHCAKCAARMAKEKVKVDGLAGVFHRHVTDTLKKLGKRAVVWDEALGEGLDPSAVVMVWHGPELVETARRTGRQVVLASADHLYFDQWQSKTKAEPGKEGYLPWQTVLDTNVGNASGIEATLWTEHVTTQDELDALLLPRLAALSEVAWGAHRESFPARFTGERALLDASSVKYFVDPPEPLAPKTVFLDATTVATHAPPLFPDGVVRSTTDGHDPTTSSDVFKPFEAKASVDVAARLFLPSGRMSPVVRGRFERTELSPANPRASAAFPDVTYSYYETPQIHALPDFRRLVAKRLGVVPAISAEPTKTRAEYYGLVFDAFLRVPVDGVYRIVAAADDGVAVEIDDRRVLTDDGEHPAREVDGQIALASGLHPIRVLYFQSTGGKSLALQCAGPGVPLGPCALFSPISP
jgi:hexosaminidase